MSLVVEGIELRLTKLSGLINQETDIEGEDLDGVASLLKGETGQFGLAAVKRNSHYVH